MSRRRAVVRVNLNLLMPAGTTVLGVLGGVVGSDQAVIDVCVEHADFPEVPEHEVLPDRSVLVTVGGPSLFRTRFSEPL